MGRICITLACTLLGILITNISCLEEGKDNPDLPEIVITDNGSLKRIEVRNWPNVTSTIQKIPTVIQQGNNLFIKPKFIFGSPFSSYKEETKSDCCDTISVTMKVLDVETSVEIRKPPIPQVPTIAVPPVITPLIIEDDIFIPPSRFPVQPQTPIVIPNLCANTPWVKVPNDEISNMPIPCPPFVVPISPNPPQLPRFPIAERPIRPVVIPKPPELPPMILPKLPIQVIIQRPIFTDSRPILSPAPIPKQPMIISSLCPPMVKCIPPEKDIPSISDIFSAIFENVKNFVTQASQIDLSRDLPDQTVLTPDFLPEFPTMCAQGIIAERVVPNIVKNDDVEVLMTPIVPSPFIYSGFYRK